MPLSRNISTELCQIIMLHLFEGVQYNSAKSFVTILLTFFFRSKYKGIAPVGHTEQFKTAVSQV